MILKTIIDRLNQRIEVSNIFDRIYGLCELTGDKGWIYYIGDGQAIPVTDYDSKQGSLFWAKRGKVNISKIDSLKVSGCKQMYSTKFNLSAYAIVRKSHLPCDGEDAGDWVASRVYKLVSGRDYGFKEVIDVVSYEVIPNGYTVGDKTLPPNFEFATVVIDLEVEIVSGSEDTCYDICNTGDIPLPPDFLPCNPCLTEVAVDGVTIIGNGTPADPLIAVGGGPGGSLTVRDENTVVATGVVNMNFRGNAVNANSSVPGSVNVDIQEVQLTAGTGISVGGTYPSLTITNTAPDQVVGLTAGTGIGVSGSYPNFTITNNAPSSGGTVTSVSASVPNPTNPALSVAVTNPTTTPSVDITANGLVSQYVRGDGSLANFPASTGGGASVNYYLNGSVNQGTFVGNTYYEMNRVPIIGSGTDFQRTNAQGDGYIAQFITDANDPNLLSIPAGNWNLEMYFSASSSGGSPAFYVELYKYDGAAFTLIATDSTNPKPITSGTTIDTYLTTLAVPQTTLLATDRLAIRVYVITSGRTITLHTEDNHLCQIITTFTTGLTALNGLTEQVQSFATGTTGTDFGITSAAGVHTFNLPTASASNRGALSTTDWSTFNGKFNTPTGTTSQYVRGDGSLATMPLTTYKSATDTAGFSSTLNTVVYTQLIPANTFAAGDIIRITYRGKKLLTNGVGTLRIYTNATPDLTGTPLLVGTGAGAAVSRFFQMQRHLVIKTNTNNTEVCITNFGIASDNINTGDFTTLAINWTNAIYIVFALQNNSALDTNYGSMYLIEKL